jgi:hypothetical protein
LRLREEVAAEFEFEFEFEEVVVLVVVVVVRSITDCSFFRRLFTILPSSMLVLLLVLLQLLLVVVAVVVDDFNFSLFPGIPQSSQLDPAPSSCS